MWAGEMEAFAAWTEGMEPEKAAFLRAVLYHQPARATACTSGCHVSLGSNFVEHQWDEFVKLRNA